MSENDPRSDLRGRKLDVICYLEGAQIPIKSVSISAQVGIPTVVTITTLPPNTDEDVYPTTHVALFYAYLDSNDWKDVRDKYKLLFHGELTGTRYVKSGVTLEYQLLAIDSRAYLNRLPDRMWPILYDSEKRDEFFPEFKNDAAFLGIDYDSKETIERYVNTVLKYFQVGKSDYTLKAYMDKILGLLSIQATGYRYYYHANKRYRISDSHIIKEYGNAFKTLHGALRKSSMIHNMNMRLYDTAGTTLDAMVSNLVAMGFNYTSVIAPKYRDINQGAFYEYILMRDMINHRAPKFNFILIDEGDSINITTAMPNVTATKYKYKTSRNNPPIDDSFYPSDCMKKGGFKMTKDEKIYGVSREIQEMDWFYNTFLKDGERSYTGNPEAQTLKDKQQYEFLLKRTGRNSVACTKRTFIPGYVLGMPAIAYDPVTNRCYRGNIWRLSHVINLEGGSCMTSVEMVNSMRMEKFDEANTEGQYGCNPIGKTAFLQDEANFYNEVFYGETTPTGGPLLSGADISNPQNYIKDNYYKFIERDHCTLRQYMSMHTYQHPAQQDNVPHDLLYAAWDDQEMSDEVGTLMHTITQSQKWLDDRIDKEYAVLRDFWSNAQDDNLQRMYNGYPSFDFMFLYTRKRAAMEFRFACYETILRISREPSVMEYPSGWTAPADETPPEEVKDDPATSIIKAGELEDYDPKTMRIPAGDEALYMKAMRTVGKETKSLLQWRINNLKAGGKWPSSGTPEAEEISRLSTYRDANK